MAATPSNPRSPNRSGARTSVLLAGVTMAGVLAARVGAFKRSPDRLRQKYERPGSRYLELPGARIHYHDEGSGAPVVLIHGSYGTLRGWDPIVEELLDRHRCIRWDQPGMGLSTVAPDRLAKDLNALSIMEALLDAVGVGRVSIVATSSGGTLATAYAAAHPNRVDRLVIANAPPDPVVFREIDRPRWLAAALALVDDVLDHRPLLLWWAYMRSLWGVPSRLSWRLVKEYRDFWAVHRPEAPSRLILRNASTDESIERLGRVVCPVLLVWGVRDYVLPRQTLETYAERLTQADVHTVEMSRVGHYPPLEAPDEFLALVRPFLEGSLRSA